MWKWMRFMFLTELNATRETFWIFSGPATKSLPDPVYPVYVDTNVMAGNTGSSSPDGSYEGLVSAVHSGK